MQEFLTISTAGDFAAAGLDEPFVINQFNEAGGDIGVLYDSCPDGASNVTEGVAVIRVDFARVDFGNNGDIFCSEPIIIDAKG